MEKKKKKKRKKKEKKRKTIFHALSGFTLCMSFRLKGLSLYDSSAHYNKNTIASTSGHQSWQLLDVECKPNSCFSLVFFKKDWWPYWQINTTEVISKLWSGHSDSDSRFIRPAGMWTKPALKRVAVWHYSGTPNSNSIKQTICFAPVIAKYVEKSWTSIKRNLVTENIFCQTLDLWFYRVSSALVYS